MMVGFIPQKYLNSHKDSFCVLLSFVRYCESFVFALPGLKIFLSVQVFDGSAVYLTKHSF